jgi:hypothetical protein
MLDRTMRVGGSNKRLYASIDVEVGANPFLKKKKRVGGIEEEDTTALALLRRKKALVVGWEVKRKSWIPH